MNLLCGYKRINLNINAKSVNEGDACLVNAKQTKQITNK